MQIGLLPLFIEGAAAPWNNALEIAVGGAFLVLLGWHVALLPAFLGELVPFFDLFPTWTAAVVFVVTRKREDRHRRLSFPETLVSLTTSKSVSLGPSAKRVGVGVPGRGPCTGGSLSGSF